MVGQTLWVFGGLSSSGVLLNDAWSFSFATFTWRQALASSSPSPRYLHVAFLSGPSSVCIFGGTEVVTATLLPTSTAQPSIFCLNTALPDNPYTIESPAGAVSVAGASLADAAGEAVVFGGAASGAVVQSVQVFNLASRTGSLRPTANVRVFAAGALSSQGIMWQFGGINNINALSTFVLATGPSPTWAPVTVGCEAGYTGPQCNVPVCRNNCWGVGRCIAPDLCECNYGFTGALCSTQLCTTCGIGLLPLNQPVYWPRAHQKADTCIDQLAATIQQILALLPSSPETCAQKSATTSPLNLTSVSKSTWDFTQGPAKALVQATVQTLQLLKQ
jgi:hypothetical protein